MQRGKNPESLKNLQNLADMPEAHRREIQSLGGIASGKKRRENRAIRDMVRAVFSVPIKNTGKGAIDLDAIESLRDLKKGDVSAAILSLAKLAQLAAKGDLSAIKLWFEMSGEARQNLELSGNVAVKREPDFSRLSDEELKTLAELVAKTESGVAHD